MVVEAGKSKTSRSEIGRTVTVECNGKKQTFSVCQKKNEFVIDCK
jgi:hypothetical protein